ncbi:hypothetical protein AB6F62_13335 [Providencia huaxiensis]|uniref:hypothetical protein n=1 Tax=Providencia huaxiensis TaxID=2027290 RepID=UPI0034DDC637
MEQSSLPKPLQRNTVLDDMKRVLPLSIKKPSTAVYFVVSGKPVLLKDTDWERGVLWSCVVLHGKQHRDNEYLAGVLDLHNTGFRTGPNPRFADDHVCLKPI